MLLLSKGVFLLRSKRCKLLNYFILNDHCVRCIASSTSTRGRNNNSLSVLFPTIPIKLNRNEPNTGEELSGKLDRTKLVKAINNFHRKPELKTLAEENGLDTYLLQKGFISFRKYCLGTENLPPDLHIVLSDIINNAGNELDMFPYFLQHMRDIFPHLHCMDDLKKIGDLRTPADWYPGARNINRKITFHCGPTNSGKTYHAIKSFFNAKSGIYCGPLKLLAVEIFHKANNNGTPCDLVTGEEIIHAREDRVQTNHVSCTVEMCSLENDYEVAVIDEIQMIRDIQRGWAWTRALLGLKAKEIHICGEESALDLIDSILCTTNEDLEVQRYQRLTELEIDKPIEKIENVQPGDCIVCFSKRDIFHVTEALESKGVQVAVIYGTLPPGTKLSQCQKFNDPQNNCKILVATDAIGMGLNLSIRRIIFYTMEKSIVNEHGAMEVVPIPVSQALQIAGRAGRYGSRYLKGFVTTFRKKDLPLLEDILSKPPEPVISAGLLPTVDQLEMYSYFLPNSTLSNLMEIFINLSTVDDSLYFICDVKDFQYFAEMIELLPLPIRVKYIFCSAPINKKHQFTCSIFLKFAKLYSENSLITFSWLCKAINWPVSAPKTVKELVHLESVHDVLDLYLWLSYRFPDYFPDADHVKQIETELDLIIQKGIINIVKLLKFWDKQTLEESHEPKTSSMVGKKTSPRVTLNDVKKLRNSLRSLNWKSHPQITEETKDGIREN